LKLLYCGSPDGIVRALDLYVDDRQLSQGGRSMHGLIKAQLIPGIITTVAHILVGFFITALGAMLIGTGITEGREDKVRLPGRDNLR
jgi:hypothetical protein